MSYVIVFVSSTILYNFLNILIIFLTYYGDSYGNSILFNPIVSVSLFLIFIDFKIYFAMILPSD